MDCSWEHCRFSYFSGEPSILFFFFWIKFNSCVFGKKTLEKGYVNAAITHTSRCRSTASVRSLFLTTSHGKLSRRCIRRPILFFFFFLRTTCQFVFSLRVCQSATLASQLPAWFFFFGCLVDGAKVFLSFASFFFFWRLCVWESVR